MQPALATQPELLSASLYYREAGSDKVYQANIEARDGGYVVNFAYGRRGAALSTGTKTSAPVPYDEAVKVFNKLVKEKSAKGYTPDTSGKAFAMSERAGEVTGLLPQLLNALDESEVATYLNDSDWFMQQKYDGRRLMVRKVGDTIEGANRKGLLVSLPQEVVDGLADYPNCVLDGELVGSVYHVFDALSLDGEDLTNMGYAERDSRLLDYAFGGSAVQQVFTASTHAMKRGHYERLKAAGEEGVVFKHKDAPYSVGRPPKGGTQRKFKFYATCSAVVAKVNAQRSVALSLGGVNVGNVTIPPNQAIPNEGDIVEIRYLYAYKGGSLYQPTYLGKRDDIDSDACTLDQLKFKAESGDSDDDA